MWPGKYTFSLSNKLSVRVSASKKQTTQHTLDRVIGGECNRGTLRWNRVRGAPESENNGTLFSLQGLKCWGNQNPDTERTVERAPDGNWLPGWGMQPDLCDSMAHCSHSSASVASPQRKQDGLGACCCDPFQSALQGPEQQGERWRVSEVIQNDLFWFAEVIQNDLSWYNKESIVEYRLEVAIDFGECHLPVHHLRVNASLIKGWNKPQISLQASFYQC